MKAGIVASLSLVASVLAAPANQGHDHHGARHHHHHHVEKREPAFVVVWETVTVGKDGLPLATIATTVTEDSIVTPTALTTSAVAENAKLAYAPIVATTTRSAVEATTTSNTSSTFPTTSSTTTTTPSTTSTTTTTPPPPATTSSTEAAPSTTAGTSTGSTSGTSSSSGSSSVALQEGTCANPLTQGTAPSETFPDGTIPCSEFPASQPGVVSLPYLGNGGWTGIQLGDGASTSCTEGALCSYACQNGMLKTQWPATQPSDGESRGGLTCTNGYLYLSDSTKPNLCEWGQLSGFVQSGLSEGVAICQTDYPGSENMVIPTWVAPGSTVPISVANEDTYYQWEGKKTSSQFYVNNQGISQADGCLWGTAGSGVGNYAPMNFGAGYTDSVSWLSMFPNPNSNGALNFNVKFVDGTGTMNGECYYENGAFGGSAATSNGCTVACSGSCYWSFY